MRSTQRLAPTQSELKEWINAPPEGCCLESCDPVLQVSDSVAKSRAPVYWFSPRSMSWLCCSGSS